jgi:tetratricopeptide (TPR) repeat protein
MGPMNLICASKLHLIFFSTCLVLFSVLSPSNLYASDVASEIVQAYKRSDYLTVAKLLEEGIKRSEEKPPVDVKTAAQELYSNYLTLAYIHAWKLGDLDKGLTVYKKAAILRTSNEAMKQFPSVETYFIAGIYERKGDLPKAKASYQEMLTSFTEMEEKPSGHLSDFLGEDLIRFLKYQLDGLSLKEKKKDFKPLLPEITLSSVAGRLTLSEFLVLLFVPRIEVELTAAGTGGVANHVIQTPADPGNMLLDLSLIVSSSAGSVTADSEEAVQAYLRKYPESYWSFLLEGAFYKFYKQNGQDDKADGLLKDLMNRAKKREIELVNLLPDQRFSSPEETWKNYINALKQGDLKTALECYVPGQKKHRQVFNALGVEKMKEAAETMGRIEKIKGSEKEAEYVIKRLENGKELSYFINFYNIDGEWKMREF